MYSSCSSPSLDVPHSAAISCQSRGLVLPFALPLLSKHFCFIIANAYAGFAEVLGHFLISVPVLISGAGLARCDCSTMPFNSFLLATSCSLVGETYSAAAIAVLKDAS